MQINVAFESFEEMKAFANKMAGVAAVSENVPVKKKEEPKTAVQDTAPVKEIPVEETLVAPAEESVKEEAAVYTLVDVRAKLGALTKAGKKVQVQELIKSFGVDKLSQIPEDKYQEVMRKAGEL